MAGLRVVPKFSGRSLTVIEAENVRYIYERRLSVNFLLGQLLEKV